LVNAPASAQWDARVEGPDVFGNVKAFATTIGAGESIVIQCDQKEDLFVAYVFRKKPFEDIPNVPAELLVQADGGTPLKLVATLRSWNDNYGGVVASGRAIEQLTALRLIASARGKTNVGAVIFSKQISSSFSSQGSRSAMERSIKSCKLDDLEKKS
jgi:hypothetical protein